MPLTQKMIFVSVVFLILGSLPASAQTRLSTEESEKLVIERVNPPYPPFAKLLKLQEIVKVEATVSEAGVVTSTKLVSGTPAFKAAALDAVKKRRYKPYKISGKPTPFVTIVDVRFSLGIPQDEYEQQQKISRHYFEEDNKCRELYKSQKLKEAEVVCKGAIQIADQLSNDRQLEKMSANELVGYVMIGQGRYEEALNYYSRARECVKSKLNDTDAEMGSLYGHMAIAYHALRNLDKARELYRKAERTYQLAYAKIDAEEIRVGYRKVLKQILEYHMIAAEQVGATEEMEEIKKLTGELSLKGII